MSGYLISDVAQIYITDNKTGEEIYLGDGKPTELKVDIHNTCKEARRNLEEFDFTNTYDIWELLEEYEHRIWQYEEVNRLFKIYNNTKKFRIKKKLWRRMLDIAKS